MYLENAMLNKIGFWAHCSLYLPGNGDVLAARIFSLLDAGIIAWLMDTVGMHFVIFVCHHYVESKDFVNRF